MDVLIDFARGPLFRISLAVLVLGLAYRFFALLAQILIAWRRAGDRQLPTGRIASATLGWIVPRRRWLSERPFFSAASVVFHAGIIIVPLFLAGHVALVRDAFALSWPTLPPLAADILTVVTLVAIAALLVARLRSRASRELSTTGDAAVLVVLFLVVLAGFFASHPTLVPMDARWMVLLHMLLGNLALILTPTTKIAHCVLFPLTRLAAALAWRYPAASGQRVAMALGKENQPV
jgi:nitrate reductase gamma subunit